MRKILLSKAFSLFPLAKILTLCMLFHSIGQEAAKAQNIPVFAEHPDITISCSEDLPSFDDCEATSPDCVGPVSVTTFYSETGSVEQHCTLAPSKLGNSVGWAFWLSIANMPVERWKFSGTAYLETYADGTAHLWGTIVNYLNSSYKFEVSLWFESRKNWEEWSALGRGYQDGNNQAGSNYLDWDYYELNGAFSTFIGVDALEGNSLTISHYPTSKFYGFQNGIGANNKNANSGFGGAFCYTGIVLGEHCGAGVGHLSVDTSCDEGNEGCASTAYTKICRAEDTCGGVAFDSQTIYVIDDIAPVVNPYDTEITVACGEHEDNFITATDNCSEVFITYTDEVIVPGCGGQRIRHYTIMDGCGNAVSATQTINMEEGPDPEFIVFPEDIIITCEEVENLPQPIVEWIGPCNGIALNITSETVEGDCSGSYSIIRTYTLTDNCGNLVDSTWTIHVNDNTAPLLIGIPQDISLNCGDAIPEITISAIDACSADVNVTLSAHTEQNLCGNYFIRTWTAVDGCGNTSSASQTISISDAIAPVFVYVPEDIYAPCGANIEPESAIVEDACSEVFLTWEDEEILECGGGYIRTWIATDGCGNAATATTTVSFADNEAPVFVFVPDDITAVCGESYDLPDAIATDNCSNFTVTYDDIFGVACGGSFTRTYTATDGCGNSAQESVNVTIIDTEAPEVISAPADVTVNCDQIPTIDEANLEYVDACGAVTLSFNETIESAPNACAGSYTIVRHWVLTDDCGNSSEVIWNITVTDQSAPILQGVPSDIDLNCGDAIPEANVVAIDNCDPNVNVTLVATTEFNDCGYDFIRTWTAVDGCGNIAQAVQTISLTDNEPPVFTFVPDDINLSCEGNASIDDLELAEATDDCLGVTVLFEDTPLGGNCGDGILRTFTATDACGNIVTATQTISFTDDVDPEFAFVPSDITVDCGSPYELAEAVAIDNCSSVLVAFEDDFSASCGGGFVRTYTATDGCGNSAQASVSVTIIDTEAPEVISAPADVTVNCDQIPTIDEANLEYVDACGAVTVSFSETTESAPNACAGSYTIVRHWVLTDDCGNSSEVIWNIAVTDQSAPILQGVPSDINLNCGDAIPEANVVAIDNCDPNVNVTLVATTEFNDCGYNFIRTWTAVDGCGNMAQAVQTISLTDNEPPVFTFIPSDVNLACSDGSTIDDLELAEATDDCLGVTVLFEDTPLGGNCGDGILRTFTATDACGNAVTATQTISFTDNVSPVFTFVPSDITLECGGDFELEAAVAEDNCSSVIITFEDTFWGACGSSFTRIYTATDGCGNSAGASVTVTFLDLEDPEFLTFPEDQTLMSCGNIPSIESSGVTYSDNCSDLIVEVNEEQVSTGCANNFNLIRTWTLTDGCGNIAVRTWTLYIVDEQGPQILGVPSDIAINCGEVVDEINVTAIDNCSSPENIEISLHAKTEEIPCGYVLVRTWTAVDECGNETSVTHTTTVMDTEEPEFIYVPASFSISCGDEYVLDEPIVMDDCSDLQIVTTVEQLGGCAGSFKRVFTATDACGNVATAEQVVTLTDDIEPTFVDTPSNVTVSCGNIPTAESAVFTYYDNCSDLELTVQETIETGDCPGNYDIVRVYQLQDECGNRSFHTWIISVVDDVPPVFAAAPSVLVLDCSAPVPPFDVIATDDCGGEIIYSSSEQSIPSDCGYQLIRSRTATDVCGNEATITQTVTVEDFAPPALSFLPENLTIDCSQSLPEVIMPTALDQCSGQTEVFMTESSLPGDCPGSYTLYRVFRSSDDCGNEAMHVQTITVADLTGPEFINFEPEITIECSQSNSPFVIVIDNCSSATLTYSDQLFGSACSGGLVRTYIATDVCGNQTEMQQFITLIDETAPEFLSFPADVEVSCDEIPSVNSADIEYQDNCSEVEVIYFESVEEGDCPNNYTISRTWTLVDNCFNSITRTWVIEVSDTEAPQLIGVPQDMFIDCTGSVPVANVFAIDNCGDEIPVSLFATTVPDGCNEIFIRRWFAEDACGNLSQSIQNVVITDLFAPVLSAYPSDITIGCGEAIPEAAILTATDNCAGDLDVEFAEVVSGTTNCPIVTRTWCATDCVGNEECHTQVVTSTDGAGMILNGMHAWRPNTSSVIVEVSSAENDKWTLNVYDITGRLIAPLYSGEIQAGERRQFTFSTATFEDAIYIIRYSNGKELHTQKLLSAE